MMAAQAMSSFAVFAWMAPILRHRGMEAGASGSVVAASIMLQVAGSLVAPILAARMRRQSWLAVAAAVLVLCVANISSALEPARALSLFFAGG